MPTQSTPKRLFDIPKFQFENFPNKRCLSKNENGGQMSYSTKEYLRYINQVSQGLMNLQIKKGDKVAIIAYNCPEWHIVDMAIMKSGGIVVPIYSTISSEDYKFIFTDAAIRFCFVEEEKVFQKIQQLKPELPHLEQIFSFKRVEGCAHWTDLKTPPTPELKSFSLTIKPTDIATIIYTSGTSGTPKGVILTHKNILSNVQACLPLLPIKARDRVLSFLPVSHIFERMLLYVYQSAGVSIFFATSLETIGQDIRRVKPHLFSVVPRIIEKVMETIKGRAKSGTLKHTLLNWALDVAVADNNGLQKSLANLLVFRTIKKSLGGEIKAIVCGSAALEVNLLKTFLGMGIPIYEGYGLTETSPVVSVNYEGNIKPETVGKPLPNVTVKVAPDGEILIKGDNVMQGYYNQPELTAQAIDTDGFFHSGDLGIIDEDGYLKITGRKKELFKTSGGKYINPVHLENEFRRSPFISQIMVVGERRKFPAALIVPEYAALNAQLFPTENLSFSELCLHPKVIALIQSEVDNKNLKLGNWEKIKKFALLPNNWSVESGELTPKLSIRRNIVLDKYLSEIESIYAV